MTADREWTVRCPDGIIWDEVTDTEQAAREMQASGDKGCGCEMKPHGIMWRDPSSWRVGHDRRQ